MRLIAFAFATIVMTGLFAGAPSAKAAVAPQAGLTSVSSNGASAIQEAAYRHHRHRRHRHHHHR